MDRGGCASATVKDPRYVRSPIPKGGLEIIVNITFTITDDKKRFLERLRDLITNNYETPEPNDEPNEDQNVDDDLNVYVIDDSGDEGETLDIQFEDDESEEEADAQGSQ